MSTLLQALNCWSLKWLLTVRSFQPLHRSQVEDATEREIPTTVKMRCVSAHTPSHTYIYTHIHKYVSQKYILALQIRQAPLRNIGTQLQSNVNSSLCIIKHTCTRDTEKAVLRLKSYFQRHGTQLDFIMLCILHNYHTSVLQLQLKRKHVSIYNLWHNHVPDFNQSA